MMSNFKVLGYKPRLAIKNKAVHKLCRLGRGKGRGVPPKTILDDGGEGGGSKERLCRFFVEGKKKSEGKIAAKSTHSVF